MKKRNIWRSICCRLDQLEDELNGLCFCFCKPKKDCGCKQEFCDLINISKEKCEQKNGCCH